jgi:hypothetical protein
MIEWWRLPLLTYTLLFGRCLAKLITTQESCCSILDTSQMTYDELDLHRRRGHT